MRWADVVETSGWWTIPSEKAKNGQAHRVPLTEAAVALVAEARADGSGPSGWVFAGPQGGSLKVKGVKAIPILRACGLLTDDPALIRYWRHDLRRTVATGMERIGVATSTISKVMNHVDAGPRATKIYARHDYDREKREALEAWRPTSRRPPHGPRVTGRSSGALLRQTATALSLGLLKPAPYPRDAQTGGVEQHGWDHGEGEGQTECKQAVFFTTQEHRAAEGYPQHNPHARQDHPQPLPPGSGTD